MSFLWNWITSSLQYLGLMNKSGKLMFLGLDNAGKTTLLAKLKDDRNAICEPTVHPNSEILKIGKLTITTFDMGGHKSARKLWADYFPDVSGIVYLVDAADRMRFPECKEQLLSLLDDEALTDVPFLILGNKIDIASAASEEELRMSLGIHHTTGKDKTSVPAGDRAIELFMCSVVKTSGYSEGFKWFANHV